MFGLQKIIGFEMNVKTTKTLAGLPELQFYEQHHQLL